MQKVSVSVRLVSGSGLLAAVSAAKLGSRAALVVVLHLGLLGASVGAQLQTVPGVTEIGAALTDVGDVNGDGMADAVCVDYAQNRLCLKLATGEGFYGDCMFFADGPDLAAGQFGDIDADGDLDLIGISYTTLSIRLGTGTGTFGPKNNVAFPMPFSSFAWPASILVVDINGDGADDVVLPLDSGVAVFLADGMGGVTGPTLTNPQFAISLRPGDLDEDGILDVLAAGYGNWDVSLLAGHGDGTFSVTPTGAIAPRPFLAWDIDEDGHEDIASSFGVWSGDGSGGFTLQAIGWVAMLLSDDSLLAAADFNEDGHTDVITGYEGILLLDGAGGELDVPFDPSQALKLQSGGWSAHFADVDGDGHLDAVAGYSIFQSTWPPPYGALDVLLNNGQGGAATVPWDDLEGAGYGQKAISTLDVDQDGDLDLVILTGISGVAISRQGTDGHFGDFTLYGPGVSGAVRLLVGDLDGDGRDDVVAIGSSLRAYLTDPAGELVAADAIALPFTGHTALADVNEDGLGDVVQVSGSTVRLWIGDGSGSFSPQTSTITTGPAVGAVSVAVADVDQDAHLDLVIGLQHAQAPSFSEYRVYSGDGAGGFALSQSQTSSSLAVPYRLVVQDVNADGWPDLLAQDSSTLEGIVECWLNSATPGGSLLAPVVSAIGPPGEEFAYSYSGVMEAVADLTGDAVPDIVVSHVGGFGFGQLSLAVGDGVGGFTIDKACVLSRDLIGSLVAVADVDHDDSPEVLVARQAFDGKTFLYRVDNLAPSLAWSDLGDALGGKQGKPQLSGAGPLLGGTSYAIALRNASPASVAYLTLGFDTWILPFKGGLIVPSLDAPGLYVPLVTDASGDIVLSTTWPPGVPSGFAVYFQYWIQDAVAPYGFSASNGLKATAP